VFFIKSKNKVKSYAWSFKNVSVKLIDFEGILNKNRFEVGRYFGLFYHKIEKEGFSKKLFGLKLNLIVHFLTKIRLASLISGHQVDNKLPTMVILSNDGQLNRIVKHVSKSLGGQESSSNEGMFRRIPKRIILLIKSGNDSSLKVLL
jgi:hypothetical protein